MHQELSNLKYAGMLKKTWVPFPSQQGGKIMYTIIKKTINIKKSVEVLHEIKSKRCEAN